MTSAIDLPTWISASVLYLVAAVGGVLLLVLAAMVSAAVSELVVRIAAWMYSPWQELRATRLEEWLRQIEDMSPSERPGQAGSFLWAGLKRLPGRAISRPRPARATTPASPVSPTPTGPASPAPGLRHVRVNGQDFLIDFEADALRGLVIETREDSEHIIPKGLAERGHEEAAD